MLNKLVANIIPLLPKKLVWVFSKRYIAGETIDEGVLASKLLNENKIEVTIDLLGEFIKTLSQAEENKNRYIEIITRFTAEKVKGNFSLKPTMFGLLLDKEVCYNYIREIVAFAASKNSFVRIDMEDSQCVDREIELFRKLRMEFPANVGLVVQAYMRRTLSDLESLADLNTAENPLNFRLCKGIYVEPENIAFQEFKEVQANFLQALDFMLRKKMYVGIATHDKQLVAEAYKLLDKYNVPKNRYEFQMLFGVTPDLRKSIVEKGHLMRVYVPYGEDWFGYSTRRLKENPKIAAEIIKALFVRG